MNFVEGIRRRIFVCLLVRLLHLLVFIWRVQDLIDD